MYYANFEYRYCQRTEKKNVLNFEDQDYNLVHLDFKYTQFRSKKKTFEHIKKKPFQISKKWNRIENLYVSQKQILLKDVQKTVDR